MRSSETRTVWLMAVGVLLLSALVGLLIPLMSGNRLGGTGGGTWTPPPTGTPTAQHTQSAPATPAPTYTATATRPATSTSAATATLPATGTPAATLTQAPTATPPAPSPTPTATAATVATAAAGAPIVKVSAAGLLLRTGPGPEYPIMAIAQEGDTFSLTGRNAAGNWWRVCCVNGAPVWLAAEFVTVTGQTGEVPVVP